METLRTPVVFLCTALSVLAGCGGGGGAGQSGSSTFPVAAYVLEWDPPARFADHKPLDPARDLDRYELYLRQDEGFTDQDTPVATVPALSSLDEAGPAAPGGGYRPPKATVLFSLDPVLPLAARGRPNYISLRAVGVDGLRSGFMTPVVWDLG